MLIAYVGSWLLVFPILLVVLFVFVFCGLAWLVLATGYLACLFVICVWRICLAVWFCLLYCLLTLYLNSICIHWSFWFW